MRLGMGLRDRVGHFFDEQMWSSSDWPDTGLAEHVL